MDWRSDSDCAKIVVLISDAPPHGIGSEGDGFPDGVPGDHDPLVLAKEMARNGITLHFVACEPTLSLYKNATEFYRGLTRITSGLVVSLTAAKSLATCIIGSVLETLALEQLIQEQEPVLANLINQQQQPPSTVVVYLYQLLSLKEKMIPQLYVEGIYKWDRERIENVYVWSSAPNISAARARLKHVNDTPLNPDADRFFNPHKYVKIGVKNTSDDHVKVTWLDKNGNIKLSSDGRPALCQSFPPRHIREVWMEVNEIQRFRLEQGRKVKEDERAFTRNMDYDVAMFWVGV